MQMLDEKMKSLNVKLSGRVLRKITPIYDSKNKEELYSKIGAGIVSLDNLDKALKVNSKSKILKFWTLFIPQKKEDETDDAAIPGEIAPAEEAPATEPQFEIAECCKPIPGDKVEMCIRDSPSCFLIDCATEKIIAKQLRGEALAQKLSELLD